MDGVEIYNNEEEHVVIVTQINQSLFNDDALVEIPLGATSVRFEIDYRFVDPTNGRSTFICVESQNKDSERIDATNVLVDRNTLVKVKKYYRQTHSFLIDEESVGNLRNWSFENVMSHRRSIGFYEDTMDRPPSDLMLCRGQEYIGESDHSSWSASYCINSCCGAFSHVDVDERMIYLHPSAFEKFREEMIDGLGGGSFSIAQHRSGGTFLYLDTFVTPTSGWVPLNKTVRICPDEEWSNGNFSEHDLRPGTRFVRFYFLLDHWSQGPPAPLTNNGVFRWKNVKITAYFD